MDQEAMSRLTFDACSIDKNGCVHWEGFMFQPNSALPANFDPKNFQHDAEDAVVTKWGILFKYPEED
jgi:hypothetical protein